MPVVSVASEIFAESAPLDEGDGSRTMYVNQIVSDIVTSGTANIYLKGQDIPNGPVLTYGPYTVTYQPTSNQPTPARARGKLMSVRYEAVTGDYYRKH